MALGSVVNIKASAVEKQADVQRRQQSKICFPLRKEVKSKAKWHKKA